MSEFLGVHLVGSMQAGSSDEVFQTIGSNLKPWVRRVSDGDIGISRRWLFNEWRHYSESGLFEEYEVDTLGIFTKKLRLKTGVEPDQLKLPPLNYVANARESYPIFARRKADGTLPGDLRFMVCMPTPGTSINLLEGVSGRLVKPAHEAQIQATIKELVELIPRSEIAIQWDVVRETRSEMSAELVASLAELADWVPEGVEVGYHFCFGDRKARGDVTALGMAEQGMTLGERTKSHERLSQPSLIPNGMTTLRDMCRGILAHASRRITFMHLATLPAVSEPLETAYAELDGLGDEDETEFYLGLLDIDTGVEGTRRQIEAAAKVLPRFGIGPECGLQRIDTKEYEGALEALSTLARELSA